MNDKQSAKFLNVLVVDDTELNQLLIAAMLKKMGHNVSVADNGAEAITLLAAAIPDLIMLDVRMPEMDGYEVARVIRRDYAWVPIFLMSANMSNEDVVRGLHAGADDFLLKPLNYEILQSKIVAFQMRVDMSVKLAEKNKRLLAYHDRIRDEAEVAREFIKQFVALDKINDPLVRFLLRPAENFSGDMIAVARTPDDRVHVLLADSAGHGLTAALAVMPITQPFYQMTAKGFDIPSIIREINRRVRDYLPLPRFVAAIMVSINLNTKTIQVWNGGCPPALLLRPNGKDVTHRFVSNHLPLGVVDPGEFDATLEYFNFEGKPGYLMMCSDGATEIAMGDGLPLGHNGLLLGAMQSSSEQLFGRIEEAIENQLHGAAPADDIALILVDCMRHTAEPLANETLPIWSDESLEADGFCDASVSGKYSWGFSLTLTAEQLKRLDVVPFLLNITGQIDGGKADGKLFLVLSELFNNALDHGVLKLDSSIKNQPDGLENYFTERSKRLAALDAGEIVMHLEKLECGSCDCLKIFIRDSGDGFDQAMSLTDNIEHSQLRHGRGIALLQSMCNDLEYMGNGSEVLAHVLLAKH
ncbi:MAG: fused response regulator/phosphatase [Gallionella sp.]